MRTQPARKKGDAFSDSVYSRVLDIATKGGLAVPASYCRVYREKGYPANMRKGDIHLDVSIEIWAPNAPRWSMLWAFECKDYARTVPVTALETFSAHLNQVAPFNRKGIMVTKSAYSSEALEFANNSGMALVRILPDDQVEFVMFRGTPTGNGYGHSADFADALADPDYTGLNQSFFASYGGSYFSEWKTLLSGMAHS
ncbi:hypothetical protein R75461_03631 [Paraburkholderia nemoris]|uniref:restriction endonuclease n=1 Tax=Paraburkholderia nemoris TaxID=2793076 RepID=UPI00190D98F2|nr:MULTISPECIES: restriction endonuclease [Paraburkholderia]MBK3744372.1 hypothetical protein [Paraburkholderia aspalathi]MBK3783128.1 hypothetical protein [Paraburkholderia aspalathi]CAE6729726.1 hypothetical protein R69619_01965 [Paraburkholderia nemoris]CAE6766409.1 hypothetical protein R75461_03631 [Paraburkholderia nemoris]